MAASIYTLDTLIGTTVHLCFYSAIQSTNHVAEIQDHQALLMFLSNIRIGKNDWCKLTGRLQYLSIPPVTVTGLGARMYNSVKNCLLVWEVWCGAEPSAEMGHRLQSTLVAKQLCQKYSALSRVIALAGKLTLGIECTRVVVHMRQCEVYRNGKFKFHSSTQKHWSLVGKITQNGPVIGQTWRNLMFFFRGWTQFLASSSHPCLIDFYSAVPRIHISKSEPQFSLLKILNH